MSKIKVTVTSVMLNEMFDKLQINIANAIPGIVRTVVDDDNVQYSEGSITTLYLDRAAVTAQLCNINDDVQELRNCVGKFDPKAWSLLLRGSVLELERTLVKAGEEYPDDEEHRVAEHDCYSTKIVGFTFGERAKARYDAFMAY